MDRITKVLNFNTASQWWHGYVMSAVGYVASFIVPIQSFIILALALLLADLVTGIRAAIYRKEKIKSRKLQRLVEKLALYLVAILSAEGMRRVFGEDIPFTYLVSFAICITEFQSVIENIEVVTGINIWSGIKRLLPKSKDRSNKKEKIIK